ncbi:hypothetical protein [Lysobacter rhizosphaerae]
MGHARYFVRVHAAVFCIAALFGLMLFSFGYIERGQLFFATVFLMIFGEAVLAVTTFCGRVLEHQIRTEGMKARYK